MADFELIFCNPQTKEDKVSIPFTLTGSTASQKWLLHLQKAMEFQNKLPLNNRWSGWSNEESKEQIRNKISYYVDVASKHHPEIFKDIHIEEIIPQDTLNYLHSLFENYRGHKLNPHPLYESGTEDYKNAIDELNIYIHKYERTNSESKTANFNFQYDHEMNVLTLEDRQEYEVMRHSNSLYLEFNTIGKALYVFFTDDDQHVDIKDIKRYEYLNADFTLYINGWSEEKIKKEKQRIDKKWHTLGNALNAAGFYRDDPNNTLGFLRLAHSEYDDIESLIEPRQFLCGAKFW